MKISVNGVQLFVEVFGAKLTTDGPRMVERPTVVVLHGGPSDHNHMLPMIEPILDIAQVVLYDHRGCGRSEHGDPSLWNMNQWADDVHELCNVLGIEKPIVFGHSFGGMVAQTYAIRHAGHASKLIFAGTGPRFDVTMSADGFRLQGGDTAAEAFTAWVADPNPTTTAAFVTHCRHLYTFSRTMNADAEARTVTNIPLLFDFFAREIKQFDVMEELATVTTPTMILGGAEDPVMPPAYQDALQTALCNADVIRFNFPQSGHTMGVDVPQAFAQVLRDFVRQ